MGFKEKLLHGTKVQPNLKFLITHWKLASDLILFECKIPQSIEQTYSRLEQTLLDSNCKITDKDPPHSIQVIQGSLMGVSPMSAKKVVSFSLSAKGTQTKVEASSQISSDWKNWTLYGNVISALVIALFIWITNDINSYIQTSQQGFWTWIAQLWDSPNMLEAVFVSNLIQAVTIFLVAVVIIEILIVIYVYPRKNAFSQHILKKITT